MDLQSAQSVVAQRLRAVGGDSVALGDARPNSQESVINLRRGEFLGVVVSGFAASPRGRVFKIGPADSGCAGRRRGQQFWTTRGLVERERERQRMEQEINIARDIQQALFAEGFSRSFPIWRFPDAIFPCLAVGGDYFDVFSDRRWAVPHFCSPTFSGTGLGAAIVTTCCKGALFRA